MTPVQTCSGCRFYQAITENSGLCRRRAPVIDSFVTTRPHVENEDWCGEWEAKPTAEEILK